jgi:5-methylcytosine-specific restriction endonuclease McrA
LRIQQLQRRAVTQGYLVNIANKIPVEDASKNKKKYLVPQGHAKPLEDPTLEVMRAAAQLVNRITSTHPSSLGLHPAVYFYAANYRHQPTSVLAVAQFVQDMADDDGFLEFTKHRAKFENFLVGHKMYINQLTVKHGSMAKGFLSVRDYYRFIFGRIQAGRNEQEIEAELAGDEKYQTLVKERPTKSKKAKAFSQDAKNVKLMNDVLEAAFVCNLCGARIDKKSMHLDHIVEKSSGGIADIDNSQWLHPYCDSTAKGQMI